MSGLSSSKLKIARALASTLFDRGSEPVPEPRLDWMVHELGDYALKAGRRTSRGLALIFTLLQLLPLFVIGKFSRFTSLNPADQLRYLHRIDASPALTPLLATAKIVLSLVYFEHPDVLPEAGIHPSCLHPAPAPTPLRAAREVAS